MALRLISQWSGIPIIVAFALGSASAAENTKDENRNQTALTRSFANWKSACDKLPSNRSLKLAWPRREILPLARFSEFDEVLTAFFAQCQTGSLSHATNWVGAVPAQNTFFDTGTAYFKPSKTSPKTPSIPFEPYAQKLSLPEGSEIFFRADLHGDVRSLLKDLEWLNEKSYLRDFTIAEPNFYMIFLGDYTDRGAYGIEVLYTLFRLKLANPDRVFLARGNHEEVGLQSRFGFLAEGSYKYGQQFNAARVERAYDFLPVVIYAGTGSNFIQCNHGGMEPGFRPQALLASPHAMSFQLLGRLNQREFLRTNPEWLAQADRLSRQSASELFSDFQPEDPGAVPLLGFMWNDFTLLTSEPHLRDDPKRGMIYGAQATGYLLRSASSNGAQVQAVFRGHQQSPSINPMMRRLVASRGVYRHWQERDSAELLNASVKDLSRILEQAEVRSIPSGSVWTFNVGPDSVYGERCDFSFDTFGILKTARDFPDWRLKVINVPVP
jgi:hypothetical protein